MLAEPPVRRRLRKQQPVPLGLLTRRVRDDRPIQALGRGARLAPWPQLVPAHRRGERLIRAGVAQRGDLVEQRGQPQVRVVGQPLPAVADELRQPVRPRRRVLARSALAV